MPPRQAAGLSCRGGPAAGNAGGHRQVSLLRGACCLCL
jgi:hypothetical protein